MRLLKTLMTFYILGLLVFYTAACFDTRVWDFIYFSWSKIADAGLLAWATLYVTLGRKERQTVKWMLCFSVFRFAFDVQSFFTGISVNNELSVAALFLGLLSVITYLSFREFEKISKYLYA